MVVPPGLGVDGVGGPGGALHPGQLLRAPHLLPGGVGVDTHGDAAVLVRAVLLDLPVPPRLPHNLQ